MCTPTRRRPSGSGVIVNSNDNVEIFDNEIVDNATSGVIISSYYSTGYYTTEGVQEKFDPYPEGIYIYGNTFRGGGDSPGNMELKALKLAMFGLNGRLPEVSLTATEPAEAAAPAAGA